MVSISQLSVLPCYAVSGTFADCLNW